MAIFNISFNISNEVYLLKKTQITYLKVDKAFIKVSSKYTDFVNVFSSKLIIKLPKYTSINHYAIKSVDDEQPLYGFIYCLGLLKFEI